MTNAVERAAATEAIRLEKLTKRYGHLLGVEELDLVIPQGTVLGLVGPKDAGKTTTLRLMLGLARPTAGRAHVLGHDLTVDPNAARDLCGFLPADPAVARNVPAQRFLEAAGVDLGLPERVAAHRIEELLHAFRLADVARKPLRELSWGYAREVGLVAALLNRPRVLFLDEPGRDLERARRHRLFDHLSMLAEDGVTVVACARLVTELGGCSHFALLHRGRLVSHRGS